MKGMKKVFGSNPINYQKLRKDDVLRPKGAFFKKSIKRTFRIQNTEVTEISHEKNPTKLLIFLHGGAFVSGPSDVHWQAIKEIVKRTDYTLWLCNYPKAPEHKIIEISHNIDEIHKAALDFIGAENISYIGDSVGGTLICSLVQRLIKSDQDPPEKIVLISPVMDASLTNPEIVTLEPHDPMLCKVGVLSAKQLCAEDVDLKDPMISPLYGSFKGFPPTLLFIAGKDLMSPDEKLAYQKMKEQKVNVELVKEKSMPHIWPILPVMREAKEGLNHIIKWLQKQ